MLNWLSINKLFRSISLPQPNRWQTVCVCLCVQMRWHVGGCEQGCSEWNLFATGKTFFADCFLSLHANTSTLALHTHTCSCHWLKSKCECNCLNSINSMPRCSPCFSSLLSARQTGQRLHLLAGDSQMNCCMLWRDFPIQRVCDKCVLLTGR